MNYAPPTIPDRDTPAFSHAALRLMLAIVAQCEPEEAAARLAILRADGHLPA